MPTSTALGYNTGSTIVGTQQIGNLAVVTATTANPSLNPNGVKFWMGPDQDLGYVIGVPVSGGTQPTPIGGLNAFLGFLRSSSLTDTAFLNMVNVSFNQNFTSTSGATNYLNSNGYWTSYVPSLGQIYRIYNASGVLPLTFSYTKKDGSSATTNPINPGNYTYILASAGSLSDSVTINQLAITDLIITSDVEETPSFTETLITTTGSGTWTKPLGVTQVVVECWAGGAAGGGASTDGQSGSGGAGGGFARKFVTYSSPSSSISYSVAASVVGTTGNGASGNTTSWDTNVCIARGGGGGRANDVITSNGAGIASTTNVGDIVHDASNGGNAFAGKTGNVSGAGGISFGSTGTLSQIEYGGSGGTTVGPGVGISNSNGVAGSNYGGGGSGADRVTTTSRSGGAGAQGLIRIIYR